MNCLISATLLNSRIRKLQPHHWISVGYSLSSRKAQVQTKRPGKDEGEKPQAQKR
ncbi:hypothetical protein DFR42_102442 [Undibacterium pigrum]|uniref:Uncharacterized protein n=1 Tax=Undibacterium pigrum TaxID=401470 RepID=A0A318JDQ2_9BURK|nr:hypothetical protein DFR42_102442 [Undibacterium pigrum]